MFVQHYVLCLVLCFISSKAEEQSAFSENLLDITADCTRKCTLDDPELGMCWEKSLDYYTQRMAQAVSGYAGTLMYIHRWRQRNGQKEERAENAALERYMKEYNTSFLDEEADGFRIQPEVIKLIFQQVLNSSKDMYKEKYTDELNLLPNFSCPTPCDYDYGMWRILFFVMLGIFVLSLISFGAYLYSHKQQMKNWRGEKLVRA